VRFLFAALMLTFCTPAAAQVPRGQVWMHLDSDLSFFWELDRVTVTVDGEMVWDRKGQAATQQLKRTGWMDGGVADVQVLVWVRHRGPFGPVGRPIPIYLEGEMMINGGPRATTLKVDIDRVRPTRGNSGGLRLRLDEYWERVVG